MPALELKNIHKSFGDVEVLKNVNLSVEEGEFIIFVGPSGCGKSTLLRIVAGLEDATSGDVIVEGTGVNALPPSKRGIAMVFPILRALSAPDRTRQHEPWAETGRHTKTGNQRAG